MVHHDPTSDGLRSRKYRRCFLLALIPAVLWAGEAYSADEDVAAKNADPWKIQIVPRGQQQAVLAQKDSAPGNVLPDAPTPPADAPKSDTSDRDNAPTADNAPTPAANPFATPKPADAEPMPKSPSIAMPEPAISPAQTPLLAQPMTQPLSDGFGIAIIPNGYPSTNGLSYRRIYDSIPFSRTEYLANPSYRHEATMELLTGMPRQTGINRHYDVQLNTQSEPQPEFLYNRYGGYGAGGYGPVSPYGGGWGRPQYAPSFRYFLPINYGF